MKKALREVCGAGDGTDRTHEDFEAARRETGDLIGLEGFCEIQKETVEKKKRGKRRGESFLRKKGSAKP